MPLHFVCRVGDVPRGECREFTAGGRRVLVCESRGEYFTHSPTCTHLDYSLDFAPVCAGLIECTWHGFRYDVVTGENVYPGATSPLGDFAPELSRSVAPLQTYTTERRGDEIYVSFDVQVSS